MANEELAVAGEKVIKTACALCVHSCGMDVHVKDGRIVKVEGMKEHPLNKGELCPRGAAVIDWEYSPERLKYPMKKTGSGWQRISWDEALDTITAKLMETKEKYGARAVTFACGSIGAEDIMMAAHIQRFRAAFGSPNYISDHEPYINLRPFSAGGSCKFKVHYCVGQQYRRFEFPASQNGERGSCEGCCTRRR